MIEAVAERSESDLLHRAIKTLVPYFSLATLVNESRARINWE